MAAFFKSDIVALNESEHRHSMLKRFHRWEDRAEYWTVSDIDVVPRKSRSLQ
jgi:hypothetical protein